MATDLAVPPRKFWEYLRASVSSWAWIAVSKNAPAMNVNMFFFMILIF
jgi:hypothetical protein